MVSLYVVVFFSFVHPPCFFRVLNYGQSQENYFHDRVYSCTYIMHRYSHLSWAKEEKKNMFCIHNIKKYQVKSAVHGFVCAFELKRTNDPPPSFSLSHPFSFLSINIYILCCGNEQRWMLRLVWMPQKIFLIAFAFSIVYSFTGALCSRTF